MSLMNFADLIFEGIKSRPTKRPSILYDDDPDPIDDGESEPSDAESIDQVEEDESDDSHTLSDIDFIDDSEIPKKKSKKRKPTPITIPQAAPITNGKKVRTEPVLYSGANLTPQATSFFKVPVVDRDRITIPPKADFKERETIASPSTPFSTTSNSSNSSTTSTSYKVGDTFELGSKTNKITYEITHAGSILSLKKDEVIDSKQFNVKPEHLTTVKYNSSATGLPEYDSFILSRTNGIMNPPKRITCDICRVMYQSSKLLKERDEAEALRYNNIRPCGKRLFIPKVRYDELMRKKNASSNGDSKKTNNTGVKSVTPHKNVIEFLTTNVKQTYLNNNVNFVNYKTKSKSFIETFDTCCLPRPTGKDANSTTKWFIATKSKLEEIFGKETIENMTLLYTMSNSTCMSQIALRTKKFNENQNS